jgi:FkbM family methyltransferase
MWLFLISLLTAVCQVLSIIKSHDVHPQDMDRDLVESLHLELSNKPLSACIKKSFPWMESLNSSSKDELAFTLQFNSCMVESKYSQRSLRLLSKAALLLSEGDVVNLGSEWYRTAAITSILASFDSCSRKVWSFNLPSVNERDELKEDLMEERFTDCHFNCTSHVEFTKSLMETEIYKQNRVIISSRVLDIAGAPENIGFLRLDTQRLYLWDTLLSLYSKVVVGGLIYLDNCGNDNSFCEDIIYKFRSSALVRSESLHYLDGVNERLEGIWWIKKSYSSESISERRYLPHFFLNKIGRERYERNEKIKKMFFSYEKYDEDCITMDPREGKVVPSPPPGANTSENSLHPQNDSLPCSFKGKPVDSGGKNIDVADCQIELVEHRFVYKYVQSTDVVLELGARYGTTSCAIAFQLKNSGKAVAVEPDPSVWKYLHENRRSHNCNFWIYHGAVSDVPFTVFDHGYGTRTYFSSNSSSFPGDAISSFPNSSTLVTAFDSASGAFPLRASHMSLNRLQTIISLQFNVLLIDCEGCLPHLLPGDNTRLKKLLKNVRLILLEGDMGTTAPDCKKDCVDYQLWVNRFREVGFKLEEQITDSLFTFINHYVFVRNDSIL